MNINQNQRLNNYISALNNKLGNPNNYYNIHKGEIDNFIDQISQQVNGGRRTYRKKNRTVRRKTRKIRKAQKGGFTYNIHTKRTALTTSTTRRKRKKLGRKTTTTSKKTTTH